MTRHFTSESVSEGHPDKVADQISDAILDAYLQQDPDARVACECLITKGHLVIAGEVASTAHVDPVAIARQVIRDIGYDRPEYGFDYRTAAYTNLLHEQSPEINRSVADGGAGDQGLMFGYACNETPDLMPLPLTIAHQILLALKSLRQYETLPWLLPDAKSQVTVRYEGGRPAAVETVVLSTQHKEGITREEIASELIRLLIDPVVGEYLPGSQPKILINPSGSFTIGGPHGDAGLTGRKIIVDTYGGAAPHGGGAFSGKDPSKVDRSAAYAARYVAKHVVAAGLADRCTVQISYSIGKAEPTSLYVDLHGSGRISENRITEAIARLFDLRPNGIIAELDLKKPIYRQTAAYGHFGKEALPWERLNENILNALKQL